MDFRAIWFTCGGIAGLIFFLSHLRNMYDGNNGLRVGNILSGLIYAVFCLFFGIFSLLLVLGIMAFFLENTPRHSWLARYVYRKKEEEPKS